MDHRNIIDRNREDLVKSIDVSNTTLWEKLIQLELFESDNVKYIKVSRILKSLLNLYISCACSFNFKFFFDIISYQINLIKVNRLVSKSLLKIQTFY